MSQTICKKQTLTAKYYPEETDISDWLVDAPPHIRHSSIGDWHDFISPETVSDNTSRDFEKLVSAWEQETINSSSLTEIILNSHYQQIIGMGDKVLGLLFDRIQSSPDHWFWALNAITGVNPIAPEDAGDVERMTMAWLNWGREHGYVSY